MLIKYFNLSNKKEWNYYLAKLQTNKTDIYFTPEYYQLYEDLGDGKANCFVFEHEGDIAIYPFLLNSINELGYELDKEYFDIQGAYGYNGVIASNYNNSFRKYFYMAFYQFCNKNNIVTEFTRFNPLIGNHQFSEDYLEVSQNRQTYALNLEQPYEDIWSLMYSSKNRNMIRKSQKNNLSVIVENKIDEFHQIYIEAMEQIKAKEYYCFPIKYFQNMQELLNKNTFFLFVIGHNEKKLAAMILFLYGDYAHYHLSGRARDNSDNSVNNFLLDEAIKLAQQKGAKFFHFGGGITTDKNDNLLKFKSNFSKERLNFYIGKKIHNPVIYDEVIRQWEEKAMHNKSFTSNNLLRYREI
jgi:lipid II:glycine glycyltransferase (peptidoglycan interpeptide bridge formation enzyme)